MSTTRASGLETRIGSVVLPNPVLTASGTSGHGAELGAYFDLSRLGAIVVKSLAAFSWPGNPAPRLRPVEDGMLNSVGLQGPGVAGWLRRDLPGLLRAAGARRREHLGPDGRRVRRSGAPARRRARGGRGGRGQRLVSEPRRRRGDVRRNGVGDRGGSRSGARCRSSVLGEAVAGRQRPRSRRQSGSRSGRRSARLWSTPFPPVSGNPTSRRRSARDRADCPVRCFGRSRCGRCRRSPRTSPVFRSSVSAGSRPVPTRFEFLAAGAVAIEVGTATLVEPRAPMRVLDELGALLRAPGTTASI